MSTDSYSKFRVGSRGGTATLLEGVTRGSSRRSAERFSIGKWTRFARIACPFVAGAVIAIGPDPAHAASITKGPYLQALGQKAVTIKLEVSMPETVTIDVTGPANFKATRSSESAKRFHSVRIDGLSPGTTYDYKVTASGTESASASFTTAPAENKPFKFVVYGDNRSDASTHAAIVRMIEKAPADFLVHTGDMVQTGDNASEWQEFFQIENKLLASRCIFVAVGNHELTTPDPTGQVTFLRYFASVEDDGRERPHLYGSFRWANTRFFMLNAMDTWTGDEREWLKSELASAMNEPGLVHRIVVLHHGPFSSGRHGNNVRLHRNGIVDILRDHKVSLVLAGHDHLYDRGEGQGIKYIVSGGAGAPLYSRGKGTPETQKFESVNHYLEVAVDGDTVSIDARRASGSIIERCSFKGLEKWSCNSPDEKPASTTPRPVERSASACVCSLPGAASSTTAAQPLAWLATLLLIAWRRQR
ncbi:MAG: metallophosphoesterase [Polyangiaceae bacterium]|nr:metallophosphoesterase [Polyangiaceae bacterium]